MSYPKWKYHAQKEALVVQNEEEEKALGEGWCESPAEFEAEGSYKEHMAKWESKKEKKSQKPKADKAQE